MTIYPCHKCLICKGSMLNKLQSSMSKNKFWIKPLSRVCMRRQPSQVPRRPNLKVKQLRGQERGKLKKMGIKKIKVLTGLMRKYATFLMLVCCIVSIIMMEPSQCSTGRSSMKLVELFLVFLVILLKRVKSCII